MDNPTFIPVNEPLISQESKNNVLQALETGWISSAGSFVKQFEENFADYLGVKHAISVTNGTAALHVALMALGIKEGDEVIVPAFTMAATWLAVIYTGAKPVFVDCEPDTYNINAGLIETKITKKTKAIIPVHIYGHSVDMDPVMRVADQYGLSVIEDAAEAHGGEYKGKKCGSIGHINCFSFYGNKIITTGEGGMVVTNDDQLAYESRKIKDLYHSDKKRFIHEKVGYNFRMTNLQAAIGCGELTHIDEYINLKRQMADRYTRVLKKIPGILTPIDEPWCRSVHWMYAIQIIEEAYGINRDQLKLKLKEAGIDTRDFFYSPLEQPVLSDYLSSSDKFPVTSAISQRGLYLPSGLALTPSQLERVVYALLEFSSSK
jgi:perosamine synthetase